jgi:hypothetical protein
MQARIGVVAAVVLLSSSAGAATYSNTWAAVAAGCVVDDDNVALAEQTSVASVTFQSGQVGTIRLYCPITTTIPNPVNFPSQSVGLEAYGAVSGNANIQVYYHRTVRNSATGVFTTSTDLVCSLTGNATRCLGFSADGIEFTDSSQVAAALIVDITRYTTSESATLRFLRASLVTP